MFADIFKQSANYETVRARLSTEPSVLADFGTFHTMAGHRNLMSKYKLDMSDVMSLASIAREIKRRQTQADYILKIQPVSKTPKGDVVHKVNQEDNTFFVRNMLTTIGEQVTLEGANNAVAEALVSLMNFTKETVSPVEVNKAILKDTSPDCSMIAKVSTVLEHEKAITPDSSIALLAEKMLEPASSVAVVKAFVKSAPVDVKMLKHDARFAAAEKEKVCVTPILADCEVPKEPKFGVEQSISVYSRLSTNSHSRRGHIGAYFSRHVHGIPVRADMVRYFDFITDLRLNDKIKKVFLFTKDIKYAVAILNAYPDVKVIMKGKTNTSKDVRLIVMRSEEMRQHSNAEDSIAVWIDIKRTAMTDKSQNLQEVSRIGDVYDRGHALKNKYYFRYLDPYAMREDEKYCISLGSGRLQVIETNVGPSEGYRIIWFKLAAILIHRHFLPWHMKAMMNRCDWFPPLREIYDFSITKKIAMEMSMSGFMSFVEAADDEYGQLYNAAINKKVEEHVIVLRDVRKLDEVLPDDYDEDTHTTRDIVAPRNKKNEASADDVSGLDGFGL